LSEARAGIRRYGETELGERYSRWVAHYGEGDHTVPSTAARTLGDLTHPARPGTPTAVVNAVSQAVSTDVAPWRWERLVQFYAGLEQRHQSDPDA